MVNPASGVIKEQARGTAQLEAGETYIVNATETRTISSVAVKKGDHIEIGDPLFYMEDQYSDEYTKAKEEYEKQLRLYNSDSLIKKKLNHDQLLINNYFDFSNISIDFKGFNFAE